MKPAITALACVTPPHSASQEQAARFAIDAAGLTGEEARFAQTIYRRSGVGHRASSLLDGSSEAGAAQELLQRFHTGGNDGRGPTTAERMTRYAADATALAHRAAAGVLDLSAPSGVNAADITHIITVSCTGFTAPGIDHALIERLGLSRTVRRLHIGYMGCHGAINALAAARAIVLSEPRPPARVLVVCVELCSLHFQPTGRPDQVVANALFADGAAALVITGRDDNAPPFPPLPSIAATGSCVLPDSADAMGWRIGDHGFEMTLGESVPSLIQTNLRPWLASWLDAQGVSLTKLVSDGLWAVHPGGPRVLTAAADALGLSPEAIRPSRDVLAAHGNMSSPTVLFILDRLRKTRHAQPRPALLLAFGPGLSVEAALLDDV